jgi:RNA polymerase sigma-70 factor (ECF subfamily)
LAAEGDDRDEARVQLEVAFRANRDWLVRRLALVAGDAEEARDLAQETFVRAVQHWPLPDPIEPGRWLAAVGLRLAIDERRRRRRWGFLELRDSDDGWALRVEPDLWRALSALDRRTRAAIVLNVLDGYTQDEIGALLDVPRGTVASWISRGFARLRTVIGDER